MFVFFILGIVFALCAIPILDGLTSVILQLFEVIKGRLAVKLSTYNKEIQSSEITRPIGFAVEEENEDDL